MSAVIESDTRAPGVPAFHDVVLNAAEERALEILADPSGKELMAYLPDGLAGTMAKITLRHLLRLAFISGHVMGRCEEMARSRDVLQRIGR